MYSESSKKPLAKKFEMLSHFLMQDSSRSLRVCALRLISSLAHSVVVSGTPNPKTFVYTAPSGPIPKGVANTILQHLSVSDVHPLSDRSLAVTFYESAVSLPSVQEEIRASIQEHVMNPPQSSMDVHVPSTDVSKPVRKTFDPASPAGRVEKVIADRIRPGVNADGGDVELVDLTSDGIAVVRLVGACNGCPSSDATLKNAIERTLVHFCAGDVKEVKQAETESNPTIDPSDVLNAMFPATMDLPKVISHNHIGAVMGKPLTQQGVPVVSMFAKKVDEKMINRIKFASTVHIPRDSKSGVDVWVKCEDCGAKKRLEDVHQLLNDAKSKQPDLDRIAVVVCPACAVMVVEK